MIVVVFNGPPRVGKDTCTELFYRLAARKGLWPKELKMSMPLKLMAKGLLQSMQEYDYALYEEEKDTKIIPKLGITYRQLQIDISEHFMKPRYGLPVFGRIFNKRLEGLDHCDIVICSDGGFEVEWEPVRAAGHKVIVVKLTRDGCTFKGDSRSYLSNPSFVIINNSTLEDLNDKLHSLLTRIVEEHYDASKLRRDEDRN